MYYLRRKIIIKKRNIGRGIRGQYRTVLLGEFKRQEHAQQVMQLMTDYGAGYGLYVHTPREEVKKYLFEKEAEENVENVEKISGYR